MAFKNLRVKKKGKTKRKKRKCKNNKLLLLLLIFSLFYTHFGKRKKNLSLKVFFFKF